MYYKCVCVFLLFIFKCQLCLSEYSEEEGDFCTVKTTEEVGICMTIASCPYAQKQLTNRIQPQLCSFKGITPIICCLFETTKPTEGPGDDSKIKPLVQLPNATNDSGQNPGQLSRNKCLEYYPTPEFLTDHIIAGGELSLVKEFPHMAAIGYGKETNVEWKCGGSLISKKFVLTAAHCVAHETEKPTFVRLGDLNLTSTEDNTSPQNFTVVRIIPHPSYAPPVKYHDIALLELDREVEFTDYVKPACLYTEKYRGETTMTATGWGKTGFSEESSSFLLKVSLDFVPHNECLTAFKKYSKRSLPNGIIEDTQICAGRVKGKDTCQGDSGGPLQVINGDRTQVQPSKVYDIIGVTSFGKACALSAAPGIYTRVSYYVPWIESIAFQNES